MSAKLITKSKRIKWDKNLVSDLCTLCNQQSETSIHILWECQKTQDFLYLLKRWARYILKINIPLSIDIVILNNVKGTKHDWLINTCLIIAKHYIYATICKNEKLNFHTYVGKLIRFYQLEKIIAIRRKKLYKHNKKWKLFVQNYI